MTVYIGFTGHRDCYASAEDLINIHNQYPDSTWITGGAVGFDEQVEYMGSLMKHNVIIIPPDYQNLKYPPKVAPLKRNELIVDKCDFLVACYDGRKTGGTYYTIEYAKKLGKEVRHLLTIKA